MASALNTAVGEPAKSAPASRADALLASVAIFLGAGLVFSVQPIAAKRLLPWFGGVASVWTARMLFFQCALLLGYLYAHLLAGLQAARRSAQACCWCPRYRTQHGSRAAGNSPL
jgi:hypothetical protein